MAHFPSITENWTCSYKYFDWRYKRSSSRPGTDGDVLMVGLAFFTREILASSELSEMRTTCEFHEYEVSPTLSSNFCCVLPWFCRGIAGTAPQTVNFRLQYLYYDVKLR